MDQARSDRTGLMQLSTMEAEDFYVPPEIILKIFLYLPGSALIKFQTLSKNLRSMIRCPDFIESHLNHASSSAMPSHILLFYSSRVSFVDTKTWTITTNLSVNLPFKEPRFGGSCNGFICFYDGSNSDITVINPTRREYLLPLMAVNLPNGLKDGTCSCSIGFVYSSKEYKLVYLCSIYEGQPLKFYVFSLLDMLWKRVAIKRCPILKLNGEPLPSGVLSHDALYWLGFDLIDDAWLLRFDLKEERVTYISLNIKPFQRESNDFMLGELGGKVCLTIMPNLQVPKKEEMHLLIFDGERDFSRKMKLMVPKHSYMMPLFVNGEKILLHDRCFDVGLYYYNLANGSCEKVFVADSDVHYSAHPHVDSLVSLEGAGVPLDYILK